MKRFRLSTLMLLIVIAALGITLVVQHRRAIRTEAELRARLSQSWPLFLKQQQDDRQMRRFIEGMQQRHREELAKRSEAEAERQERDDAEINWQIKGMQQRHHEERAKRAVTEAERDQSKRRESTKEIEGQKRQ
jgi:hypothetical protein